MCTISPLNVDALYIKFPTPVYLCCMNVQLDHVFMK